MLPARMTWVTPLLLQELHEQADLADPDQLVLVGGKILRAVVFAFHDQHERRVSGGGQARGHLHRQPPPAGDQPDAVAGLQLGAVAVVSPDRHLDARPC